MGAVDPDRGAELPRYLKGLVTSQLDADRFDYLLRDAWATGTEFGRFDLEYLLANLKLDSSRGRLYLSAKAQSAAESYVEARAHMYRAVYFHKTIRSAEVMLRLALGRYRELLLEATGEEARQRIVPEGSASVRAAFEGTGMDLTGYLSLDDVTITDFLKAAASAEDPILSGLACGIVERRLWKAIDLTGSSAHAVARFYADAKQLCEDRGYPPAYGIIEDEPKDTPYRLYDPDADEPATLIYVGESATTECELSQLSPHVQALAKRYGLTRYHFPPELRSEIDEIRERHAA
jgi:HD superfamily phosphohydrolase